MKNSSMEHPDLSEDERNLLLMAFSMLLAHVVPLKSITSIKQRVATQEELRYLRYIESCKRKREQEIEDFCIEIISLLDEYLLLAAKDKISELFIQNLPHVLRVDFEARVSMGRLVRLEVENFKSYKGHQVIGPFHNFSSVIGPNGAGKSNLMDAISFVLGVKSNKLRSSNVKDLIYRGRAMETNQDSVVEGLAVNQGIDEEDDEETARNRSGYVMAVYEDDNGKEMRFMRSITSNGDIEYRLNGRKVAYTRYNDALEEQNILVKARNFLVFQGDIEHIASQSPKDLTKLIEQISGSLELKAEYEQLKVEQERAAENSAFNFNKRRGINAEIKQYQEQKAEAQKFETLKAKYDSIMVEHLLWKLFHLDAGRQKAEQARRDLRDEIHGLETRRSAEEAKVSSARKEHAKARAETLKLEKQAQRKQKDLDELRPKLLAIDEKVDHLSKRLFYTTETLQKEEGRRSKQDAATAALNGELKKLKNAYQHFEGSVSAASAKKGFTLGASQLKEYNELKERANAKTVKENQQLANLMRQHRTETEQLSLEAEKLDGLKERQKVLLSQKEGLQDHRDRTAHDIQNLQTNFETAKKNLSNLESERQRMFEQEHELNEQLQDTLTKLHEARIDQRENEREKRLKETIDSLKRNFNGIHGRMSDICKPTQSKFNVAISTILGRNLDAIVVENQMVAMECIQYLREQRAGHATFIPLDAVSFKPVNEKYRSFMQGARLAIDVIQYDERLEKAIRYACGNALVCDTLDIAKDICYNQQQEVKAVTLDGTLIHKSGMITGGKLQTNASKRWEERDFNNLNKVKDGLLQRLNELNKSKTRGNTEETIRGELAGLESRLKYSREDLEMTQNKLKDAEHELEFLSDQIEKESPRHAELRARLDSLANDIDELTTIINNETDVIFAHFCQQINVRNIREYEESELKLSQEQSDRRLQFNTQISKMENQIRFEEGQLEQLTQHITRLRDQLNADQSVLISLEAEQREANSEKQKIENAIASIDLELSQSKQTEEDMLDAVNARKKTLAAAVSELDRLRRIVVQRETQVDKFKAETLNILRQCKLEEIPLPLTKGKLVDLNMEELKTAVPDEDSMDIDETIPDLDLDIEIDFSGLTAAQKKSDSADIENEFQKRLHGLASEIERLAPNMRAVERLEGVENRLRETETDFDSARRAAKNAKEKFNDVRQRRYKLFYDAFSHIQGKIDQIYKDLTKSQAFPLGGTAYLSLEDSEEPYLDGIKYHAMPPMKRFRDMEQLSGGEKTMAALALLFAIHSYQPSPFFVLDEVDAALDNANVAKIANYIRDHANEKFQFIVISLKSSLYEKAESLVGIYRDQQVNSSRTLTLKLNDYEE
ncbi:hypothetical protein BZG36_00272 [Bifiguratus adelaidae]|uniref:Structural maintenance of chromosomes protein n=1 Tax=Bifiguratus adelaidae TaxID=1938954 RepID=A0A261Y862_9FUNG|nr:hypothetical protein BZG36_00272 [Bifiguratus adelaidae]